MALLSGAYILPGQNIFNIIKTNPLVTNGSISINDNVTYYQVLIAFFKMLVIGEFMSVLPIKQKHTELVNSF